MIDSASLREQCARNLANAADRVAGLNAFIGLDGFVDEILHVVDKRENALRFTRMPTISALAQRLAGAAGKSTNIEMVPVMTKLGGNGPIMGNALASLGLKLTYLGALGYPDLHPVFKEFATRAEVHSIANPGLTDALEFEDGKVMVGKHAPLADVNWANIEARYGRDRFIQKLNSAQFLGFVNWTMLPYMSDIWEAILQEVCPTLKGPRRRVFFDLADPEKRTREDIRRALELIGKFQQYFDVTLGLNEKEANEIAKVLDLPDDAHDPEKLGALAREIAARLPIGTLVVHPTRYALAVSAGQLSVVKGLYAAKPRITTGAGDHFNAGFCLGKLLGLSDLEALLAGVTTSGHYVRTAVSPNVSQLAGMMRDWPNEW